MRISDLSRESGVSLPTVKFYLREGLLHPGRGTARNQAIYDASHVRRLRLIRVLTDVGGLGLSTVRGILGALTDEDRPLIEVLGVAHRALDERWATDDPAVREVRDEIGQWIAEQGWEVAADAPARDALAATLVALRRLGWEVGPAVFDRYAAHIDRIAADELAFVAAAPTREAALEATVIGTVVFERVMVVLRRLAQEHHAGRLDASRPARRGRGSPPAGRRARRPRRATRGRTGRGSAPR